ncbi:MAG: hypothetical protein HC927_07850, partial [Deltaproteobacteria bacterium]|nr:hypothetical protein [Deltaproteobacteria bacterium]
MPDPKDESRGTNARAGGDREPSDPKPSAEKRDPEEGEEERAGSFRRIGDALFTNLLGDSSAIRRGQGLVTGVAQGTKEELVRLISAEVRSFLEKMDAADLVQEIISGLVIDVKAEISFRRAEDGSVEPRIEAGETKLRRDEDRKDERGKKPEPERSKEARARARQEARVRLAGQTSGGSAVTEPSASSSSSSGSLSSSLGRSLLVTYLPSSAPTRRPKPVMIARIKSWTGFCIALIVARAASRRGSARPRSRRAPR